MKHNTWLTFTDSYTSYPEIYYIYNFPVRDPSDGAEMGFFLSVSLDDLDSENVKLMKFSFNNLNIDELEKEDYTKVDDNKKISLLNQQASIVLKSLSSKEKKNTIKDVFTSSL